MHSPAIEDVVVEPEPEPEPEPEAAPEQAPGRVGNLTAGKHADAVGLSSALVEASLIALAALLAARLLKSD